LTLVLLDTNAYLRLAKRIRPLLGKKFGQKDYALTILRDVDDEVHRSPRLRQTYPWFDAQDLAMERLAQTVRLTAEEKTILKAAISVLRGLVQMHVEEFTTKGRSPPSDTDCRVLALGQIRPAIVVTDDLGMHLLAGMTGITVWHGHELLKKMLTAKLISNELVHEIYAALEVNGDMTATWFEAKHTAFVKVFGKASM
jgi:hypothetical protein